MDRTFATNYITVSGKRQFVDANPATATPGTDLAAQDGNNYQEEICTFIEAAGVTPSDSDQTQLRQAACILLGGRGSAKLAVTSATLLTVTAFGGRTVPINGLACLIPQAGVTIANTGLANSTAYFLYAWENGGAMALELSTTGHVTDTSAANYGTQIKSGDPTRTLIGQILTSASGQFQANSGSVIGCLNWFDPQPITAIGTFSTGESTTATTATEISTSIRVNFITFARPVAFKVTGLHVCSGANIVTSLNIDGVSQQASCSQYSTVGGQGSAISIDDAQVLAEGAHYASLDGMVTSGATGQWYSPAGLSTGQAPTRLLVTVLG